ncbi:MAG: lysostaphin resistance A-like protein [Polyangiaceae bacterium]
MAVDPSLRRAPRPAAWPALMAYAGAFVLAFATSTGLVFAVAFARTRGRPSGLMEETAKFALSAPGLMAVALANAAVLFAVALVGARIQGRGVVARLGIGPSRASPGGVLAAVAGIIGLSFSCGAACDLAGLHVQGTMEAMAEALRSPTPDRLALELLTIAVAPAIAEETFFRGMLQARLTASWGLWPGIVATSLAFGIFHLDPVQGSMAFLAGLFLGWAVERLGGVRPSVLAHGINNAAFIGLASVGVQERGSRSLEFAIFGAGAAVLLASVAALRSSRACDPSERGSA